MRQKRVNSEALKVDGLAFGLEAALLFPFEDEVSFDCLFATRKRHEEN